MKPTDIKPALRRCITEAGNVGKNVTAAPDARTLAACVALLATIVGRQEDRLRALEPCPSPIGAHRWTSEGLCEACGAKLYQR